MSAQAGAPAGHFWMATSNQNKLGATNVPVPSFPSGPPVPHGQIRGEQSSTARTSFARTKPTSARTSPRLRRRHARCGAERCCGWPGAKRNWEPRRRQQPFDRLPIQHGNPEQDRGTGFLQAAFGGGDIALGDAETDSGTGTAEVAAFGDDGGDAFWPGNFVYEAAPIRSRCGNPNCTTTPAKTEQTEPDAGRGLAALSKGGEL
jgi:hypothetical protein